MVTVLVVVLALLAFSLFYLRGEDLRYLDGPLPGPEPTAPSEAHRAVVQRLDEIAAAIDGKSLRERLHAIRAFMDELGRERSYRSAFRPVQQGGVRGEWVLAPGCDGRRRVLYLHGGAWFAGSPLSHRPITDRLSRLLGAAVFTVDYRLLPEHRRNDGIHDCRAALRWILHNGPEDAEPPDFLVVAGDSAGGSLALDVLGWARDSGLRMPDAAIALSPSTDTTLNSPSLRANRDTDPMLGPAFGALLRLPVVLLWWLFWVLWRIPPRDPRVSPLRGQLSGLPPILIQVSRAEMLLDDARRYAAKARASGTPVRLQSWPHVVHAWQMFTPELPEAEQAFAAMGEFLADVEAGRLSAAAAEVTFPLPGDGAGARAAAP